MIETWSPDWSNAVFPVEERDRRWARVRALMSRDGIDVIACLPCTNSHGRGQADSRYLTQLGENSEETTVVFPIDGPVAAWHSRGGVWPSSNWLDGVGAARRGTGGRRVVDYLHEIGFERGTIGIAGLTSSFLGHVRETEGEVNWQSVEIIKRAFANARVVSATDVLGEARYQKSEAEIDFLRKGVGVSEQTIATIQQHARAGVPERHVYGEMMRTNARAGGSFTPMFGWISGPLGNTYHRVEQPTFRTFQPGDVLSLEIEGRWGGYIAQLDRTFSIGPAHQDLKDGLKQTWDAFDGAFEALRPGATVGEVYDAGELTGLNGRCKTRLLMHGRGTGDDGPLVTTNVTPELRAVNILEGCCFVLKPNTSMDGRPDYGSWGEVVVVRNDGAQRLGTLPQELCELV